MELEEVCVQGGNTSNQNGPTSREAGPPSAMHTTNGATGPHERSPTPAAHAMSALQVDTTQGSAARWKAPSPRQSPKGGVGAERVSAFYKQRTAPYAPSDEPSDLSRAGSRGLAKAERWSPPLSRAGSRGVPRMDRGSSTLLASSGVSGDTLHISLPNQPLSLTAASAAALRAGQKPYGRDTSGLSAAASGVLKAEETAGNGAATAAAEVAGSSPTATFRSRGAGGAGPSRDSIDEENNRAVLRLVDELKLETGRMRREQKALQRSHAWAWKALAGAAWVGGFVAAAVLLDKDDQSIELFHLYLWRWMVVLACLPVIWYLPQQLMFLIILLLETQLFSVGNEGKSQLVYHLMGIRSHAVALLRMLLALIVVHYVVAGGLDEQYRQWESIIIKVWICLSLFCFGNVLKCVIARLLSRHFHTRSYFERMRDAVQKEYFLLALTKPRPPPERFLLHPPVFARSGLSRLTAGFSTLWAQHVHQQRQPQPLDGESTMSDDDPSVRKPVMVRSLSSTAASRGTAAAAAAEGGGGSQPPAYAAGQQPQGCGPAAGRGGGGGGAADDEAAPLLSVGAPTSSAPAATSAVPGTPPAAAAKAAGVAAQASGGVRGALARAASSLQRSWQRARLLHLHGFDGDDEEGSGRVVTIVGKHGPQPMLASEAAKLARAGSAPEGAGERVHGQSTAAAAALAGFGSTMDLGACPEATVVGAYGVTVGCGSTAATLPETGVGARGSPGKRAEKRRGRKDTRKSRKAIEDMETSLYWLEQHIRQNKLRYTTLTDQLGAAAEDKASSEVTNKKEAKRLAFYLYWNVLGHSLERPFIVPRDLESFFETSEEVRACFKILDTDDDGRATLENIVDAIVAIYKERKKLAITLKDTKSVVSKLELVCGFIIHLLLIVVYMWIFEVNVSSVYVSISATLLAFAFVFGNSVKTLYESVLFLFVVHAFDVGDWLTLSNGDLVKVEEIALLSVTACRSDGRRMYIPTPRLMQEITVNLSRSDTFWDSISLLVDISTPASVLHELEAALQRFCSEQPREFTGCVGVLARTLDNPAKLKVVVFWEFNHTAEDGDRTGRWRSRLLLTACQLLSQSGVLYTNAPEAPYPLRPGTVFWDPTGAAGSSGGQQLQGAAWGEDGQVYLHAKTGAVFARGYGGYAGGEAAAGGSSGGGGGGGGTAALGSGVRFRGKALVKQGAGASCGGVGKEGERAAWVTGGAGTGEAGAPSGPANSGTAAVAGLSVLPAGLQ